MAAREAVSTWLGENTDLFVDSVVVSEPDVDVILVGPGDSPAIEDLEAILSDSLGYPVVVTVAQIPAHKESYSQEDGLTSNSSDP